MTISGNAQAIRLQEKLRAEAEGRTDNLPPPNDIENEEVATPTPTPTSNASDDDDTELIEGSAV